jgi:hypothetical protein
MRSVILLGMLLSAISPAAGASTQVCRGSISQEWGYLTLVTEDGTECVITRRVGMQTVINICGDRRCKVTGVIGGPQPVYQMHLYIERLIAVEPDAVQWRTLEPQRLGDPTLSQ